MHIQFRQEGRGVGDHHRVVKQARVLDAKDNILVDWEDVHVSAFRHFGDSLRQIEGASYGIDQQIMQLLFEV